MAVYIVIAAEHPETGEKLYWLPGGVGWTTKSSAALAIPRTKSGMEKLRSTIKYAMAPRKRFGYFVPKDIGMEIMDRK